MTRRNPVFFRIEKSEKDKGENFKMTSIPIKIQRIYICKLNGNESVLIIVWNCGNRVS